MIKDSPWKDIPKKSGIYALLDPDTERVMYIGQAINFKKRYTHYVNDILKNESTPNLKWVLDLRMKSKYPKLLILEECSSENLDEAEIRWIEHYGLKNLLNVTKGGKSAPHLFRISFGVGNTDVAKKIIDVHFKNVISVYLNKRIVNNSEWWARQFGYSFTDLTHCNNLTQEQVDGINYYASAIDMIQKRYNYDIDFSVFDNQELYDMSQCIKKQQTLCNYIFDMIQSGKEEKIRSIIYFKKNESFYTYLDFVVNNSYYMYDKSVFLSGGEIRIPADRRYCAEQDVDGTLWNWGVV